MAIVINGSGTVTGLSVGGLPDGTVDAGTVAADVATQAELDAAGVGGATGVDFNDNTKARFGTGNDLEIYHDGSHSYIKDEGTGNLTIRTNGDAINLQSGGEAMVVGNANGAVELYHNNVKKLETQSGGIEVWGDIEIGTNPLAITGESGSDRMTIAADTGHVWIDGNCSAASFTDRTPYPETLQLAYDVINSHKKLPDGQYKADDHSKQLDHSQLNDYVKEEDNNRNMSGVISCLVEVVKDLSAKITALENA
jgi:hypothetical protein